MSKAIQKEKEIQIFFLGIDGKKKKERAFGGILAVVFSYAVFALLSCTDFLLFGSAFELDGANWTYPAGAVLLALFFFLLYGHGKLEKKAHLMAAGMLFVWYLCFHKSIWAGCVKQLNAVLDRARVYYGIYLPSFLAEGMEESSYLAVMFASALLFWISAVGFFYWKSVVLTIFPPIALCILDFMVGIAPDFWAVFMLALGAAGCIPFCFAEDGRAKIVSAKAGVLLSAVLFFFLAVSQVFGAGWAEDLVKRHDEAMAFQKSAEDWIRSVSDFGIWQRESGRISNKNPKYKEKTVMSITLDACPEGVYYLRGYVGDAYQSGNWGSKGAAVFEEYENGSSTEFDFESGKEILNFLYNCEAENPIREKETMTIEYLNTGNSYAYLPYGADLYSVEAEGQQAGITIFGDAIVLRDKADTLTVSGYLTGTHFGKSYRDSEPLIKGLWNELLSENYASFAERYLEVPEGLQQIQSLGDWMNRDLMENLLYYHFLKAEIVPGEDGVSKVKYYSKSEIAACLARKEVVDRVSYSLDLDAVPAGEDVTQYFLFGSKKGFCQHYASAGVLLLRKLGVPARYVTGYAVLAEDFERQPDGSYRAEVKDSDAHAWAEYYEDGVGWVPVDMTEGGSVGSHEEYAIELWEYVHDEKAGISVAPEQDQQTIVVGQDGLNRYIEEERLSTEEPEQNIQQQNKEENMPSGTVEGGNGKMGTKKKWEPGFSGGAFFMALLFAALAFAVCIGFSVYRRKRRESEFQQKNNRKAVKSISYHMYHLLLRKGILRERPSDDSAYKKAVLEKVNFMEWERYFEILQLAYYSNEDLTAEDVVFCREVYNEVKHLGKKKIS